MSMIVEFRALWFYGMYQEALQRARHVLSLKRVIGEEQNHLDEMATRLDAAGERSDAHVTTLLARERTLYSRLLAALDRAVA
jgi:rubrerythrin